MAEIEVTVVRADTNKAFDVSLPDDVPILQLVAELVKEMGMPRAADGELFSYELSNKRTGDMLREDGTLATKGVKSGDLLLLTSSFVAGS